MRTAREGQCAQRDTGRAGVGRRDRVSGLSEKAVTSGWGKSGPRKWPHSRALCDTVEPTSSKTDHPEWAGRQMLMDSDPTS